MLTIAATGLLGTSAAAPPSVNAQLGNASMTPHAGIMTGGEGAASAGLEFRMLENHRMAFSIGAGRWWRFIGCDALVGSLCDEEAWSADLGLVARLAQRGEGLAVYAAPRIGILYYDLFDRRVWKPSAGIGVMWSGHGAIGFVAEIRYYVITGPRPTSQPSRPATDDHLALVAGVRLRLY